MNTQLAGASLAGVIITSVLGVGEAPGRAARSLKPPPRRRMEPGTTVPAAEAAATRPRAKTFLNMFVRTFEVKRIAAFRPPFHVETVRCLLTFSLPSTFR